MKETYIRQYDEDKLRVLPDDNEFFHTYILKNNRLPKGRIQTPSQRRLNEAKKMLLERIEKIAPDILSELKNKVERMKVLIYSVKDSAEATQIFETTNDRGKTLTDLEKTKSFLMYNMYLVTENRAPNLEFLQDRFSKSTEIMKL